MALVEGTDYIKTGEPVSLKAGPNEYVTDKVEEIYLASSNSISYLCADPECEYIHENPASVKSHNGLKHNQDRKQRVSPEVVRAAMAFNLLPAAMQETLLRRLDESKEQKEVDPVKTEEQQELLLEITEEATFRPIAANDGRYAEKDPETANPLRKFLKQNHVTFNSVSQLTGVNYAVFMNIVNGKSATSMDNLVKISEFLKKPIVELFNEEYVRRCH